jgi:hypothetical protein
MAKGPKSAPINAQKRLLAPLVSAIHHSKTAHVMQMMKMTIAAVMA